MWALLLDVFLCCAFVVIQVLHLLTLCDFSMQLMHNLQIQVGELYRLKIGGGGTPFPRVSLYFDHWSQLNYCNSLLAALLQSTRALLQRVVNVAAVVPGHT